MAGYIGTKAVLLSTTAASVTGNADIGGNLTVDTSTLFVDSTNNRVGVGTSSPAVLLDVAGSSGQMFLQNTDATANGSHDFSVTALKPGTGFNNFNIAGYEVRFKIGGASTEAMRIDSSGNVGIGTSSPDCALHVESSASGASTSVAALVNPNSGVVGTGARLWLSGANATSRGAYIDAIVQNSGNAHDMVFATNGDASSPAERMRIDASGNVGIGTSSPASNLHVNSGTSNVIAKLSNSLGTYTNTLSSYDLYYDLANAGAIVFRNKASYGESMRIDASGNLLVGTTTAGIQANSSLTLQDVSANTFTQTINHLGSPSGAAYIQFGYSGSTIGSIVVSTASSIAYNTTSDYRLKEDVQPMVGASARVLALNPVNFAWKADGTRVDGFIAHEAQAVVPEAVTGTKDAMRTEEYEVTPAVEATYDEDGNELTPYVPAVMGTREVPEYQGIDQSKLVPLLTAALQEALNEIAALKDRVAALETV